MNDVTFDPDGTARFIYDDETQAVMSEAGHEIKITRASHVEPEPSGNGWIVDMSPVGGPTLGPFETRKFALAFEVEWLKQNRGL